MRVTALVLVLMLAAMSSPLSAAEPVPHITDPAGDANAINGQGFVTGMGNGTSTPASYGPADLVSIRYATSYIAVPLGGNGIDYQATGLLAHITTTAPAISDGPTLIYRLNAEVGSCGGFLQYYAQGPASAPIDQNRLEFRQFASRGCAADATIAPPKWNVTYSGNTMTFNMPLSGLSTADKANFSPGKSVMTSVAEVRTLFGALTAPAVDATGAGTLFAIGSDMPADVPCTVGC